MRRTDLAVIAIRGIAVFLFVEAAAWVVSGGIYWVAMVADGVPLLAELDEAGVMLLMLLANPVSRVLVAGALWVIAPPLAKRLLAEDTEPVEPAESVGVHELTAIGVVVTGLVFAALGLIWLVQDAAYLWWHRSTYSDTDLAPPFVGDTIGGVVGSVVQVVVGVVLAWKAHAIAAMVANLRGEQPGEARGEARA